jgi:hypothetical protein
VISVYALVAGVRILVQVVPRGYAVYYNSVLFLIFVIFLVHLTKWACRRLPAPQRRAAIATVLAVEGMGLLLVLPPLGKPFLKPLRTDRGAIYTRRAEAVLFPQIIDFMKQQKAMGKIVLVIPEETSLYFFSGTDSPTRWYPLLPGALEPRREAEYIAQLEAQKIDYIVLSNRSTEEYGVPFFGIDYNQSVYQWIQKNYEVTGEFGHFVRKVRPKEFGALLYRRRELNGQSGL